MSIALNSGYMILALEISKRHLGQTWPNPAVGCVIVRGNEIVGRGATQPGGRPHAEAVALNDAGERARGATMYVTLEPCCHHGKTPPCTDAVIQAGIKKIVIAAMDPDPRVAGKGIAALKSAGIEVALLNIEALPGNKGFFKRVKSSRPGITLKIATSADGKIYHPQKRWITGDKARQHSHLLRARHDAILVGAGTAVIDDPSLTCRLHGYEHRSPARIILDRSLKSRQDLQVFKADELQRTVLFTANENAKAAEKFSAKNVEIKSFPSKDGAADMDTVFTELGKMGFTNVLVEGGFAVARQILGQGLADSVYWYKSPIAIGGDAPNFVALSGLCFLPHHPLYSLEKYKRIGQDGLEIYVKAA